MKGNNSNKYSNNYKKLSGAKDKVTEVVGNLADSSKDALEVVGLKLDELEAGKIAKEKLGQISSKADEVIGQVEDFAGNVSGAYDSVKGNIGSTVDKVQGAVGAAGAAFGAGIAGSKGKFESKVDEADLNLSKGKLEASMPKSEMNSSKFDANLPEFNADLKSVKVEVNSDLEEIQDELAHLKTSVKTDLKSEVNSEKDVNFGKVSNTTGTKVTSLSGSKETDFSYVDEGNVKLRSAENPELLDTPELGANMEFSDTSNGWLKYLVPLILVPLLFLGLLGLLGKNLFNMGGTNDGNKSNNSNTNGSSNSNGNNSGSNNSNGSNSNSNNNSTNGSSSNGSNGSNNDSNKTFATAPSFDITSNHLEVSDQRCVLNEGQKTYKFAQEGKEYLMSYFAKSDSNEAIKNRVSELNGILDGSKNILNQVTSVSKYFFGNTEANNQCETTPVVLKELTDTAKVSNVNSQRSFLTFTDANGKGYYNIETIAKRGDNYVLFSTPEFSSDKMSGQSWTDVVNQCLPPDDKPKFFSCVGNKFLDTLPQNEIVDKAKMIISAFPIKE
ncbi:MAG: hypothetical protein ACRCXZ_05310 [Patescibacteria group bacterium]